VRKVLREFSKLPEALRRLTCAVESLADLQREMGPGEARLDDLERSRAKWEAEMEALLMKADSSYKSAANAESRARTMERRYEKDLDPLAEDSEEIEDGLPEPYARAGEVEELYPLHLGVETNNKTLALRAKWGTE